MRRWAMLSLCLAGCFNSAAPDGIYACAVTPPRCPPGLICASDNRCRRHELILDASVRLDLGTPGDLAMPSTCSDGKLDGDETDVDCGGSCAPCDVTRACKINGDCQTNNCDTMRCELATSPPFWRALPSMMHAHVNPTVVATPDRAILAIGGGDSALNAISNVVERYAVDAGNWSPFAPTVLARSGGAAGFVAGKLYVAGGLGNENQLEAYDAGSMTWSVISTDIGFQIDQAGFVVQGGALIVFGGLSMPNVVGGAVNRFVPGTGWAALAQLIPRRSLGGALGSDGLIYAVGGNDGTQALAVAQRYAMVSGQWSAALWLPVATDSLGLATAPDGRLFAVGGNVAGAPVAAVYAYRPGDTRWTKLATLQNPRVNLGVATGGDGLVYAVGGARAGMASLSDVEAYGPVLQVMPSPVKAGAAATASGSNFAAGAQVLIYGGSAATGTPIANGTTDASGVLAPVPLPPFAGAGSFTLTAVDSRSRYPVTIAVTVTP
jgi:hypothetical protein